MDKFELVVADIFDENFKLAEQVDCVVLSYTVTTFINNYDMLKDIIESCRRHIKEGGYVLIADFEYVAI